MPKGLEQATVIFPSVSQAAIALGSNLGNSRSTLEQAIQLLSQTPGMAVVAQSPLYVTPPMGPVQPDYLNGCAIVQTTGSPVQLLDTLLAIEVQYGRVRTGVRWEARTLDLDLILFNDLVMDTPRLTIPHPGMRQRAFVLRPLADIAPTWVDPVTQQTIAQLLERVDTTGVNLLGDDHPLYCYSQS